jgi:hypothetical protein
MIKFNFDQYISLSKKVDGVYGYIVHSYLYDGDDLYLISGNSNIRHHINDLSNISRDNILRLINKKG